MYTCEEQDIVSLVDSICEVLMDEDLQDLYDYKWGCITKKVQFQALPKLITKSLNEKDFLELENAEQVLRLRKAVRDMWPSLQNETERYDLLSWIVRKWGRIPHINDETLMTYVALYVRHGLVHPPLRRPEMSSIRWIASAAKANVWHLWILKIGLFMTPVSPWR